MRFTLPRDDKHGGAAGQDTMRSMRTNTVEARFPDGGDGSDGRAMRVAYVHVALAGRYM